MEPKIVMALLRKELNDSLNNRWFMLFTVAFAGLALLLSWLALSSGGSGYAGFAGFGRTAASLINLVLLIIPLMALTVGAGSLAGEREQGTLHYLLAQPVSRAEVLLGKYLGLSVSLLGALTIGFGLSGLVIAAQSGQSQAGSYGLLILFAFILALAMLSLGFLVSVLARKAAVATGLALFVAGFRLHRRSGVDGHDVGLQTADSDPVSTGADQPLAGLQDGRADRYPRHPRCFRAGRPLCGADLSRGLDLPVRRGVGTLDCAAALGHLFDF
jgi:hypothetical protein